MPLAPRVKNGQLGTSPVVVVSKERSRHGSARQGDDLRPANLVDVQLESPRKLAAAIVHVEGTAYQGCAVGPRSLQTALPSYAEPSMFMNTQDGSPR